MKNENHSVDSYHNVLVRVALMILGWVVIGVYVLCASYDTCTLSIEHFVS